MCFRRILIHFNNRISEVVKAIIMVGIGIQLTAQPGVDYKAFNLIFQYVDVKHISSLFLLVGSLRLAALIANGNWPEYGPWMRAIGAAIGSLVWSQMFLSLVVLEAPESGSLGAPIFFVFSVVEILSIYRALGTRYRHGRTVRQGADSLG